ncbi:MAG: aminotransferase class III-fold pyridoxal phosphate-dependent enzyme [Candidatus Hydrogenedentes bacterium]|nr:aminotransferase class III-fold pyridoxal phosphate-dependent enzyme [Candidatus Hydrogenedentota bacterium]
MTAAVLVAQLQEKGIDLWAEGDRLRYRVRNGVLTDDLRETLKSRKQELLAFLVERPPAPPAAITPGPDEDASPVPSIPGLSHPYIDHVNPYLGGLLARLEMDKTYLRGEGCRLWDEKGIEYVDFTAMYGALPFGFNPPEIWDVIASVRESQWPSLVQPSLVLPAGELARRLTELAPGRMRYAVFTNSGAEANEAAIKLCRAYTGRPGVLSTENSFHGKTLGALSATGRAIYQDGFGAPAPGFDYVPFGDADALEAALNERKDYYAAFLLEPIQGEGGIVEPPDGYLTAVREITARHGVQLVFDEVQTGLGRTGALFGCNHEGVAPDAITLAKALGGGIMPIGACVFRGRLMTERFALRHSSTFAGSALACIVALTALDMITRDDCRLIRDVASNGAYLKQRLLDVQVRYPELIKSVRGKGYLLGVQLALDGKAFTRGLFGYLAEQDVLSYLLSAYLLNVGKARVAPTMSAGDVIRVEPALIAGRDECDHFVRALEQTLALLRAGDTARLIGHLVGKQFDRSTGPIEVARESSIRAMPDREPTDEEAGRFAFLMHLLDITDCVGFDTTLKAFRPDQMSELKARLGTFLDPAAVGVCDFETPRGVKARGDLILVPYTSKELMEMTQSEAVAELQKALALAHRRGARIVGLGGFTSIASQNGLALRDASPVALTTGNSYTVAVAIRAIEAACREAGLATTQDLTVAVVGATGNIGRTLAMRMADRFGRLILVGRPDASALSRARLREVGLDIAHRAWRRSQNGGKHEPFAASIAARTGRLGSAPQPADFQRALASLGEDNAVLYVSNDLEAALLEADVVLTATSATEAFIEPDWLRRGAIVYDLSRPYNVSKLVAQKRPDVRVIEGGVVCLPGTPDFKFDLRLEPGQVFACLAETALLALERRYTHASLGPELYDGLIDELSALGDAHGFRIAA